jgi:hypothetical protein
MVRSVSQGARREIRHAVVFAPKGQPMQKDVSKATRGWAVLSTTSNSRGPAGATSLFEDSIVAGERNRVEGAEGALNVTARLTLIHKFREHPERTASLCRYIERTGLTLRPDPCCIGARHCGTWPCGCVSGGAGRRSSVREAADRRRGRGLARKGSRSCRPGTARSHTRARL